MKKNALSLLLAIVCLFSLTATLFSGCRGSKLQVSFDLNYDGAPESPAAISVKIGKPYGQLPEAGVSREGYTFAGWSLSKDETEAVTAETIVTAEADHTLYAIWEGLEYTLSFDLQGGNINGVTTVEPVTVKVGNVYSMMAIPDDPERDNYTFLGWYYDAEGTQGPVSAATKVVKTCDHTLYAKWKENQLLYDFEKIEDISVFNNRGNGLSFSAVSYGGSNQLMVQNPNEGKSDEFLVMWADLKAGTRVTMDVTFAGELSADARMHLFCYGANIVGDPITTGLINKALSDNHRKWYDGNGCRAKQEKGVWYYGDENDWHEGNTVTLDFVVMEDCSGLSLWFNLGSGMEPAQWAKNAIYIDNIRFTPGYQEITEADMGGEEQKPQEETEGEEAFPFTFECGSVDSDVFKLRDSNLNMSVVAYGGSQQLKLQLTRADGQNWLWLNKNLQAGSKITFDVTFDRAGTGASMSIFGYGSKANGDPITVKPSGSAIDVQWYNGQGIRGGSGKQTVEINIYEDCYGISLMLGFDGNPDTVIYLDNFRLGKMSGTSQPVTKGETDFPFTFECGNADSDIFMLRDSDLDMSVVEYGGSQQLKLRLTKTGGQNWLWLNKELKARTKIAMDVTFAGGGTGDGMSLYAYGSKANGDPITEGTLSDTVPQSWYWGQGLSADFASGSTSTQTLTFTVYEDCHGISLMLGFGNDNKTQTAIYLDNIRICEDESPAPTEPTVPDSTKPDGSKPAAETDFPFTFESGTYSADIWNCRDSRLDLSVADYQGSKQLKIAYISNNNWLWLRKELKAGTKITMDVTFASGGTGEDMSLYAYGSKANGDPITEGTPTDTVPQEWYWGQGVKADLTAESTNTQTLTFTVYEDCHGISLMLGFGSDNKTQTAIYLDNIRICEDESPAPTEPTVPIEPSEPETTAPTETIPSAETDFPFTFESGTYSVDIWNCRDSRLDLSVADYQGSKQLKIAYISNNNWLWLHKELKAGTKITMDVTFASGDTGENMSLYAYGSKANGDPITEGTPTDTVPQEWYWGQGVKADFTAGNTNTQTLTFTVYEDCYGISLMLGFGSDNKTQTAIYLDNIRICEDESPVPTEPIEPTVPETTEPETTEPETTAPTETIPSAETDFPFTFESGVADADIFRLRDSDLSMSVTKQNDSQQLRLQLTKADGQNWLWLNKELKAGTVITMDVTFQRKLGAMSLFCYGSKANGDPITEGTPTDTVPQEWYWGQGVKADFTAGNTNTQTITFTVYEDCHGISMNLDFGKKNAEHDLP